LDTNPLRPLPFTLLPSWLVTTIVVLWFLLPHLALRFSYFPLVSSIYAVFVIFVFLATSLVAVIGFRIQKYIAPILTITFMAAAFGEYKGLSAGRPLLEVTKSAYEALAPAMLLLLLLLSRITTTNVTRSLVTPFLWVASFDAIYSIYQYFWVHHYQAMWFYESLTKMDYELKKWSYEDNGVVRATGIFTSPLENVYVISLACIYFALKTVKTNAIYALPALFYVSVGYMTGVRTFFVGMVIAFLAWFVINRGWTKRPIILFALMPLVSILATYLFLYMKLDTLDLSAASRLRQLTEIFSLMIENPMGYGFGAVGIGKDYIFDSVYGTWFVSLGVLGGGVIAYIYYWLSKQLMGAAPVAVEREDMIFLLTLILFSIDLAYISQFQYALITPSRWYYVVAAAIVLNRLRMNKTGGGFHVADQ
jgi:hypothetical protein